MTTIQHSKRQNLTTARLVARGFRARKFCGVTRVRRATPTGTIVIDVFTDEHGYAGHVVGGNHVFSNLNFPQLVDLLGKY